MAIRIGIFPIERVLERVRSNIGSDVVFTENHPPARVNFKSDRLKCFAQKGVRCVRCRIKGTYFALERNKEEKQFYFSLYATQKHHEILMTKDHILPLARGGNDSLDNLQPMCSVCNHRKGSKPTPRSGGYLSKKQYRRYRDALKNSDQSNLESIATMFDLNLTDVEYDLHRLS